MNLGLHFVQITIGFGRDAENTSLLTYTQFRNLVHSLLWSGERAIAVGIKSELLVFDQTVNSETYTQMLEEHFIEHANQVFGDGEWVLVQDGATCHTCEKSINRLWDKCIVCPEWPPNSPDLNRIEMIWGIMKQKLNLADKTNHEEAICEILRIWDNIPQEYIDRICASFPMRVAMMIDAKGKRFRHYYLIIENLCQKITCPTVRLSFHFHFGLTRKMKS
jgi:hypothetical protein